MHDREHEEWLENCNARLAAAKKNAKKPPIPGKKADDKKSEDTGENEAENVRAWVID